MTQRIDEGPAVGARIPRFFLGFAPRGSTSLRLRAFCVVRCVSVVAVSALLLVVLAVGAFFAALARGPIASDWLAPKIVEALDDLYIHRYQFALSSAAIASTDHGLTLTVNGLAMKSGERTIIAAPRAQLSVDPRALLVGRLTPHRLDVLDLELRLEVLPDGVVAISAPGADPVSIPLDAPAAAESSSTESSSTESSSTESSSADPSAAPQAAPAVPSLRQAAGALRALMDFIVSPESPIGAIDKIGVSNARLVIDDHTLDKTILYDDLALSFDKIAGARRLRLGATGPSGHVGAEVEARGAMGEPRTLDARLRSLSMEEIALAAGARTLPFDTDAPLSLDLHFALAGDGRVVEASGKFAAGEGFFRLEEPDAEPFMLQELSVAGRWDMERRLLAIEPIEIRTGVARLSFKGTLTPPADGTGTFALAFDLARPGAFLPERHGEAPLVIENAGLSAKLDLKAKKYTVDRVFLDGPEVHATASVQVDGAQPDGTHLKYMIHATQTPIRSVLRIWPTQVAAPTRMWMDEHIAGGVMRSGALSADLDQAAMTAGRYERPPPDAALRGDFDLDNATLVDAVPGLWPINGMNGHIALTGRTASFVASSGVMESAPGRRLAITEGVFRAPSLGPDPAPAWIELKLAGGVEAVADILSLKSVAPAASLPMDANQLKGQIDGKLRIDFELGQAAKEEHTRIAVDAETTNLSMERFIGKERLEGATLRLVSDHEGLRVTGSGRVFGAPVTLDLRRAAGEKGQAQAQLSLSLDDAARARAGYGFVGVSGVVGVQVQTKLPIEDSESQFEVDFSKAALDNPLPGVTKPLGKPGRASFTLVKRPDGSALEQLQAEAGPQQFSGVVELGRDGVLRSAKLTQAKLSPGDDMRLEATRGGDALKLVVRGANIDARPLLRYLSQPSSEQAAAGAGKPPASDDFDLDLKSPIVTGHGKQILSNVDLRFERRAGKPRQLSLTGNFGREPFAVMLTRHPSGAPQIDLSTSDGGALLSFLDLYHRMESGAMTATIVLNQGRSDGAMRINDFYLQNEPAVRQLVMQGAARVDDKGAAHFDPDSVKFARVQSAFTWSNGRLAMRDAVMSGTEIGLTVDGYIDMARDRIDVSGSFVPAYGLNNLVTNIPVIGFMLAGGQHEGVFAVSFRVSGAFSAPVLTVNPLSMIAPGLLRKVFGVIDGTGTGRLPESAPGTR
ncbi:hypothetical+protein [Methylocapsa aurea]|uniref:YhdP family protein n=1 Tax=Methylocapsa aurea TaxID=663610 RepID=UPI003D18DB7F